MITRLLHYSTQCRTLCLRIYHQQQSNGFLKHSAYDWKSASGLRAKVTPNMKSGKTPTDVHSYRPISLHNVIGKMLERIFYNHLQSSSQKRICFHQFIDYLQNTLEFNGRQHCCSAKNRTSQVD